MALNDLPTNKFSLDSKEEYVYVAAPDWVPFALFHTARKEDDDGVNKLDVLGVNFFSGQRLPKKSNLVKPFTPAALLKQKPPDVGAGPKGQPGMYCIGVCEQSFPDALQEVDGTTTATTAKSPSAAARGMSSDDGLGHDDNGEGETEIGDEEGDPEVVRESSTFTNRVSIAAAILWPGTNPICCSRRRYRPGLRREGLRMDEINRQGLPIRPNHDEHEDEPPWRPVVDTGAGLYAFMPKNMILSMPNRRYFHPSTPVLTTVSLKRASMCGQIGRL